MAINVVPDQTADLCPDQSVRKHSIITVCTFQFFQRGSSGLICGQQCTCGFRQPNLSTLRNVKTFRHWAGTLLELCKVFWLRCFRHKSSTSCFIVTLGPARSVVCTVRLIFRRPRVRSSGPAPSFVGIWSWNNLYDQSLPTANSKRTVASYRRKDVYFVLVNH